MSGHGRSYSTYNIVLPGDTEPTPHERATNIAKTLDDTFFLELWERRMVALGLAARPDLYALVAATEPDDKKALNKICRDAKEAARASRKANMGTALHKITERADRGEEFDMPAMFVDNMVAYDRTLTRHGIEIVPEYVERVCVVDELPEPIAGTVDRLVFHQGKWAVLDIKTGDDLFFSWRSIAIQLALYAHARWLWNKQTGELSAPPPVRRDRGIVLHLPSSGSECRMYYVDLYAGWRAAEIACAVRAWRRRENLNEEAA